MLKLTSSGRSEPLMTFIFKIDKRNLILKPMILLFWIQFLMSLTSYEMNENKENYCEEGNRPTERLFRLNNNRYFN